MGHWFWFSAFLRNNIRCASIFLKRFFEHLEKSTEFEYILPQKAMKADGRIKTDCSFSSISKKNNLVICFL